MSEDVKKDETKMEKIEIIGIRWLPSPIDNNVIGIVMCISESLQRMVLVKNCLMDAPPESKVDEIVQGGTIIHKSDAEMMLKFLQGESVEKLAELTYKSEHVINFHRWIAWVCELMNQPISYGTFLAANPSWKLLFESDCSPSDSFNSLKNIGAIVERDGRWHSVDEDKTVTLIGMTPEQVEEAFQKEDNDDQPPF